MRIAFDAKRALTNVAGLGQYSRILVNALLREFPEHEYLLYSPKFKEFLKEELKGNYSLVSPQSWSAKKLSFYWRSFGMTNDLIQNKVDVFHGLSNELPLNIHAAKGVKKIVTIHDVIFLKHKEQYSAIDRSIYNYKTSYALKHTDTIVAISEETKADLLRYYKVPEKKIEVVYQSCAPAFYSRVSEERKATLKAKYALPDSFILYVSSYFPRKNHKKLVEALALLEKKTDAHLVFIGGQGSIKGEIEAFIKAKNLQSRVHMVSGVTNEEMPSIYQLASLFVYPSFFEGFGIPILEALASGVPVIATKGGCFEEAGGKGTLYVNPSSAVELAEAISGVLSDSAKRNQMVEEGLLHAASLSDWHFAQKTLALYNR